MGAEQQVFPRRGVWGMYLHLQELTTMGCLLVSSRSFHLQPSLQRSHCCHPHFYKWGQMHKEIKTLAQGHLVNHWPTLPVIESAEEVREWDYDL